MLDQQLTLTEWRSVKEKKRRKNALDPGKLYVRYKPRKNGKHTMLVYIGNDILKRMGWHAGDMLEILRHDTRFTQYVILPDVNGLHLSQSAMAHAGLLQVVTTKNYAAFDDDQTIAVRFMECRNYVLFDIGQPEIEGCYRL